MSTRCLTIVKVGGKVKVAQYGIDGYPAGAGADIAKFIHKDLDMRKFKAALKKVNFKGKLRQSILAMTGPDILNLIQDGEVTTLADASKEDVKYRYEIDLDKKTVEVTFCGLDQPIIKKYAFKNFTRQAMTAIQASFDKEIDEAAERENVSYLREQHKSVLTKSKELTKRMNKAFQESERWEDKLNAFAGKFYEIVADMEDLQCGIGKYDFTDEIEEIEKSNDYENTEKGIKELAEANKYADRDLRKMNKIIRRAEALLSRYS